MNGQPPWATGTQAWLFFFCFLYSPLWKTLVLSRGCQVTMYPAGSCPSISGDNERLITQAWCWAALCLWFWPAGKFAWVSYSMISVFCLDLSPELWMFISCLLDLSLWMSIGSSNAGSVLPLWTSFSWWDHYPPRSKGKHQNDLHSVLHFLSTTK